MRIVLLIAFLFVQQAPPIPPRAPQNPSAMPGVTVSGHVTVGSKPIGNDILRPQAVVFSGPREGLSIQASIHPDGTFELQNVQPGNYEARTLPSPVPSISTKVVVGERDLTGVTIDVPLRTEIRGRVTMADGSSLSNLSMIAAFRSARGSAAIGVDSDGTFSIRLNQGSYTVSIADIPVGYEVKSMLNGTMDVLKDPLRVEGATALEIRITLGRTTR